jgi:hypothetical protein
MRQRVVFSRSSAKDSGLGKSNLRAGLPRAATGDEEEEERADRMRLQRIEGG